MSLAPGHHLAHYEIVEPIGKGGMGEVFRARDEKLGRDVAIKVLPDEFARDKERLARFKREAKVLASLNHPNIAAIHGLEESEGIHYLVLELVPGETLAERIARGPIPLEEAVVIATKITEGLEEAHERGIVHRDLKPANVKLTDDDKVKILDFGLAKAFVDDAPVADDSMSPTITRDSTSVGVILGTAAYMSPEQAKGKRVDRRTDIFAFGSVLYEMLTGKKAFAGQSVAEVLASVMKDEPDWARLPAVSPDEAVQRVVRRCLAKTASARFQHIGDARFDLEQPSSIVAPTNAGERRRTSALMVAALVVGFAAGAAVWAWLRPAPDSAKPISRWTVSLPPGGSIGTGGAGSGGPSIAISPDSRHIAYVVAHAGVSQLHLRAADSLHPEPVDGGMGAINPFFSADGESLGFANLESTVMKVSVRGGAPVVVHTIDGSLRGASWGEDGSIVFNDGTSSELQRVAADRGEPELLAQPLREKGEKAYRFPVLLPGDKAAVAVLVVDAIESYDDAAIVSISLETGDVRTIVEGGSRPQYSETGHLVYFRAGNLLAVPFDADALEVTGAPVRVLEGVAGYPANGSAEFALSRNGVLVYAPGATMEFDRRVVLVDRSGAATTLVTEPHAFVSPRVSPDGLFVALGVNTANMSIWVHDVGRGALTRLISGSNNWAPVWTPDGETVTFTSDRAGGQNVFSTAADGSGAVERLLPGDGWRIPGDWTPDGRALLFDDFTNRGTGSDIGVLSTAGDISPFLQTSANEKAATISPNGRWVAYESDESGRPQIYVCPYPEAAPKRQVSIEGGVSPLWNPTGRELFYRDGFKVMSVATETENELTLGHPRLLFESDVYLASELSYDVTADGEQFVMIDQSDSAQPPTELVVVQNWAEELKRLVPTN